MYSIAANHWPRFISDSFLTSHFSSIQMDHISIQSHRLLVIHIMNDDSELRSILNQGCYRSANPGKVREFFLAAESQGKRGHFWETRNGCFGFRTKNGTLVWKSLETGRGCFWAPKMGFWSGQVRENPGKSQGI